MQKAVWNGLGEGSSADPFILEVDNGFDINNSFNIKIESNFMGWQNGESYFKFSNSTTIYLLALIIKDRNELKYFMTKNAIEYTFIVSNHMNINEGPFTVTSYLGVHYLLKQQIFSIQDMALEEVREVIKDLVDQVILFDFLDVKVTELLLTDESETRITFDNMVNAKDTSILNESKEYTDDEIIRVEQKVDTHIVDVDNPHEVNAEHIDTYVKTTIDTKDANTLQAAKDYTYSQVEIDNKDSDTLQAAKDDATLKLASKVDKSTTIIGLNLEEDILLGEFKTAIGNASQSFAGLLSAEDKQRLDVLHELLEEDTENSVVDSINEILAIFQNYPEGVDLVTALAGKVEKVAGKGLSTNDLTDILKSNYDTAYSWGDHTVESYLKAITKAMVEVVLTGVITTHTHNPAQINTDANNRFVTDAQISTWNNKENKVILDEVTITKNIEDELQAIALKTTSDETLTADEIKAALNITFDI